jgi:hypothetical protein
MSARNRTLKPGWRELNSLSFEWIRLGEIVLQIWRRNARFLDVMVRLRPGITTRVSDTPDQRAMRTTLSLAPTVSSFVAGSQCISPPLTDFGVHAPSLNRSVETGSNFV